MQNTIVRSGFSKFASFFALFALLSSTMTIASTKPDEGGLDRHVRAGMGQTGAKGLAVAIIEKGRVRTIQTWGVRNAKGEPLAPETIMYGASLTKAVFGYLVMQLADEGRIDLDTSIARYLPKPLPEYTDAENLHAPWHHLAGDERWRKLTPRILLNHGSGFANFFFMEPDGRLKFHFDPGSRYSYSGDGIILLQYVLEKGLGLDVEQELQRRFFKPLGMSNTSLIWRPDFASNLADGWGLDGKTEPHDERSKVRAAGSMDTTIADFAKLAAAYVRGQGLSKMARAEMVRPQLSIRSASQFPMLGSDAPPAQQIKGLAAGLGVIAFKGPQGPGFFKGGHNDFTGNMWVCLERRKRCVVLMANDVRAEAMFPGIVRLVLGDTGMPWRWEYGPMDWAR